MKSRHPVFIWLFACCLLTVRLLAQADEGISGIQKLYEEKQYSEAGQLLKAAVSNLVAAKNADSLLLYILWTGKLESKMFDDGKAIRKVAELVMQVKSLSTVPATLSQAYLEAGELYGLLSQHEKAFAANSQALQYAMQAKDERFALRLANIENNLATYAQRMSDISLSISHGRKAIQWMAQVAKPDYDKLYLINNSVGAGMYYMLKLDSGIYFFNRALDALARSQPTAENRYYRPAIVQNNMAGIYGLQGKTTAAINAMKAAIDGLKKFLSTKEPHKKKANALEFQFEVTDNLGGIYREMGDYRRAGDLLRYSYQEKQRLLPPDNTAIFKSQILLGQLYYDMRNYDQALHFLDTGILKISGADGDYLFWQADAYSTLARLQESKKNFSKALTYYEKADSFYTASLQGAYDNIYLEFLTNASHFYATNRQPVLALLKANKAYKYVVENEGAASLSAATQLLNLSEVYYQSANQVQSLKYSTLALKVLDAAARRSSNLLDSIKTELRKPGVILLKAKAEYGLLKQKTPAALLQISKNLTEALALLERRKAIIDDAKSTAIMLADHSDLLEFIKQVNYELFELTQDPKYLGRLLGMQESGMYNRIRARLEANDSVSFAHAPASARATEKTLKLAMITALQQEGSHDQKMKRYLEATEKWNAYQEMLRTQYPRYYEMRYASVFNQELSLKDAVPADATVVRYFYINEKLYAYIAGQGRQKLIALNAALADRLLQQVPAILTDPLTAGAALQTLYQCLWQPLEADIRTHKVVIIPDRNLYNLSFELLTPQRITSFSQLAKQSLLARHSISYHYSILLLKPAKSRAVMADGIVAFAPGFSDEIKKKYRDGRPGKEVTDPGYLTLLPQPFTLALVRKTQEMFGGKSFLNEASTAGSFRTNAGGHQIIHIGTHAEADNLHPEYSRLIFTKSSGQDVENNSLFLPEIYDCDLSSSLSVLTACETGRPGYEYGEGMISLAHAFNYAGSESMLTSLWKADEKASAQITETFYLNLVQGMPKDAALRKAKLDYLEHNAGRSLSPQYWAGLVIMGDSSALDLKKKTKSWYWWLAGSVAGLLVAVVVIRKNKNKLPLVMI